MMKKSVRLLTHAFLEKVRVPSAPPHQLSCARPNVVPVEEKKFTFFVLDFVSLIVKSFIYLL